MGSRKKKNIKALEYFAAIDVDDIYKLKLERRWMQAVITRDNKTADKILACEALKEEEDGTWYLEFKKMYGLSTGEVAQQTDLDPKITLLYLELQKELLNNDIDSEEINSIILKPDLWYKLSDLQQAKAQKIFNGFIQNEKQSSNQITLIMKRIIKDWEQLDTFNLHQQMGEAIYKFIQNEIEGWQQDEQLGKTTELPSITVIESSAG